jgi:hypothetical protein
MNAKILWDNLKQRAAGNFEIHTTPQNKSVPLWFHVGKQGEQLIISKAQNHTPSVRLSNKRKISYKDFEFVCQYYDRWLKGESGVRQEVTRKSQNTAYIFALIAEARKVVI